MNPPILEYDPQVHKIHYFNEVESCLDTAFELARAGRLDEWDSVQARKQTSGRGQMRRPWNSLEGNLFGALRLPLSPPFNTTAASLAIGALCANALRSFGCDAYIKWPNDLVMQCNGQGKVGGILLEERDNMLMAGIGINVLHAPELEEMREEAALPPVAMGQDGDSSSMPTSEELWRSLVKHVYSVYKNKPVFSEIWKNLAEELLLWRGKTVELVDNHECCTGRFIGVSDTGAAILETENGLEEKYGGSMRRALASSRTS